MSRRKFLRTGVLGFGGLTLPELLEARAAAGMVGSATSVILFCMCGGQIQLESFDRKPNTPSKYRGPFRPNATRAHGVNICELEFGSLWGACLWVTGRRLRQLSR